MPALCVMGDGATIGSLERSRYPVPPELRERTGDDLDRALREFAAARVAENEQDRRNGCGPDHEVRPDAPDSMTIGESPGLRDGFILTTDDTVVEHAVTWVAVRQGRVCVTERDDGGAIFHVELPALNGRDRESQLPAQA